MLEYQSYTAHIELDDAAGIFHGQIDLARGVITFQGTSVDKLRAAFRASIDDCLE